MFVGGCVSSQPDALELLRLTSAVELLGRDVLDLSPDVLTKVEDDTIILPVVVVGVACGTIVVNDVPRQLVGDEHSMLDDPW